MEYSTQSQSAKSKDKEVKRSEKLFYNYQGAQAEWKEAADENEKFASGVQWTQKQINILKERGQAAVSINAITWAIEQMKAMLTSNKPRFQATAREDSDRDAAQLHSLLMEYMWDVSDGNSRLKNALDDYAKMGRGCLYAYVDPNKSSGSGEVMFTSVDPRDVYPDPSTKDYLWRDAAHILVVNYKTKEQIRQMYPEFDFDGAVAYDGERTNDSPRVAQQGQIFSGEHKDTQAEMYRIIDRLSKKMVKVYHVVDPFSGEEYELREKDYKSYLEQPAVSINGQIATERSEVNEAMRMANSENAEQIDENSYMFQPQPQQDPTTGEMIQPEPILIVRLSIEELVEREAIAVREIKQTRVYKCVSIGNKKSWSGFLPTSEYPVVPVNNMWSRNPYCTSDVNMVRPIQELINKLNSLIIANAASSTNQKVLLPRGSQDKQRLEAELNKAGSTVIEFDAEIGQPVIFGAQSFPGALFNQIDMYVNMIERQFGIYALMAGDAQAAPQTFKGTMAMDEFGQRRIKSKKDDIETSLNQLAKVMGHLARAVYQEEKLIRVAQPNGEMTEAKLNAIEYDDLGRAIKRFNDINQGRYDVKIISGSTLPSNRFALMEYYIDLYREGLIDQTEVLKKSNVVDVKGVLERSSYISKLEGAVEKLQEQVKNLEGDLQTATREEIHAKKRLELEKWKADLDKIKTDASAASKILQVENKQAVNNEPQQQQPPQS